MLSKSKLSKEKKEKLLENLKAKVKGCKLSSSSGDGAGAPAGDGGEDERRVISSICDVKSPHSLYPSAHRSYEVRYEPHRGRFVVASEVITIVIRLLITAYIIFILCIKSNLKYHVPMLGISYLFLF